MSPQIKQVLSKNAIEAAPLLLGCYICRRTPKRLLKLKIVETEAYHQSDPASHSYKWRTDRTAPMFEAGGTIYVYFTYGMHYAINIVVGQKGEGEAVLLRAAEPLRGIEIMQRNREKTDLIQLANGPGKLTQALGIKNTKLSGEILNKSSIWLEMSEQSLKKHEIVTAKRIGISTAADELLRFYIKDSPFVSKLA